MTRAKFTVVSIVPSSVDKRVQGQTLIQDPQTVQLQAVTDDSPENKQFFAATPTGAITLTMVNPDAMESFRLNGCVYVVFIPANEMVTTLPAEPTPA